MRWRRARRAGSEPVRITHTNDALISQLKISPGEYVHFKSKDGTTVAGYLYKPLDYVAGKKAPTILIPHGGPVWAWYAEFQAKIQWLNAAGYAVVTPNPRGSTGYGQKFAQAIFADWGNKDFQDDMAIVDYAIAQGIADPEKLGVGGHSYGAISTDFIIGQTTRFKGAISDAGEALNTTNYGHDQYQKDYEAELGRPWENQGGVGRSCRRFTTWRRSRRRRYLWAGRLIGMCRSLAGSRCIRR